MDKEEKLKPDGIRTRNFLRLVLLGWALIALDTQYSHRIEHFHVEILTPTFKTIARLNNALVDLRWKILGLWRERWKKSTRAKNFELFLNKNLGGDPFFEKKMSSSRSKPFSKVEKKSSCVIIGLFSRSLVEWRQRRSHEGAKCQILPTTGNKKLDRLKIMALEKKFPTRESPKSHGDNPFTILFQHSTLMASFYGTSLPLACTRWVWSTFLRHHPPSSKQCCWLTWATLTIFYLKITGTLGFKPLLSTYGIFFKDCPGWGVNLR